MAKDKDMDRSGERLGIGRAVKELRHKKQITLHDLAAKTGIAKTILDEIENGDVVPPRGDTPETSQGIQCGYGVSGADEYLPSL